MCSVNDMRAVYLMIVDGYGKSSKFFSDRKMNASVFRLAMRLRQHILSGNEHIRITDTDMYILDTIHYDGSFPAYVSRAVENISLRSIKGFEPTIFEIGESDMARLKEYLDIDYLREFFSFVRG